MALVKIAYLKGKKKLRAQEMAGVRGGGKPEELSKRWGILIGNLPAVALAILAKLDYFNTSSSKTIL